MDDFKIEDFLSVPARDTLRRVGLHKVAGVMAGIDELTIKEAVAILGAKAYLRRCETQKIAMAICALAELTGEKLAGLPLGAMISKGIMPAVVGGGAAVIPHMILSEGPVSTEDLTNRAIIGATLGLGAGSVHALHRGMKAAPGLPVSELSNVINGLI